MNQGCFGELKKPIMVLAPMANVTDAAFRKVIAKYGKPDVIWTEFVSADGLFLGRKDILVKDLEFSESEQVAHAAKIELILNTAATCLAEDLSKHRNFHKKYGISESGAGQKTIDELNRLYSGKVI